MRRWNLNETMDTMLPADNGIWVLYADALLETKELHKRIAELYLNAQKETGRLHKRIVELNHELRQNKNAEKPTSCIQFSLRDWFAGQALAGLSADTILDPTKKVKYAWEIADKMLKYHAPLGG